MKTRTVWTTCALLVVASLLLALRVAIPAYRERAGVDAILAREGMLSGGYHGPEWARDLVDRWVPKRWQIGFVQRTETVDLPWKYSDSDLAELLPHLHSFPKLNGLSVHGKAFDDNDLLQLRDLSNLRSLVLRDTSVTDAGIKTLREMTLIEELVLDSSEITDDAIAVIAELSGLRYLSLNDTRITDIGLAKLARLRDLTSLSITQTDTSDAAIDRLHDAIPGVQITDD